MIFSYAIMKDEVQLEDFNKPRLSHEHESGTAARVYDISPEISDQISVWPGDVKFKRSVALGFERGDSLCLSAIHTTVHLGAHVDAPNHYHPSGEGIGSRSLNFYLGDCQVISVHPQKDSDSKQAQGRRIFPIEIENTKIVARRVLLKTGSFPNPDEWTSDFRSLSVELVNTLADQGVVLIGIDTPSVDLFEDSKLEAHQAIYQRNLAILEGIVLDQVPDGVYSLIALPLKIKDADASPVRAILVEKE